ncbi:MAG: glycosyltransferase family 2 protein [Pseudomonas sp.]|jgi:glycosyltransferase involved in cell wall biosynthesis|nr:glycosyltransferase family 2 protein [Pseudomonas arcuscaelestis]MBM3103852.1 glycosyltransferase [Pseudomonas arcuscaelestis]MBM3111231.1 glycosyltransferase [Pseudomonas arcuscaelestis]
MITLLTGLLGGFLGALAILALLPVLVLFAQVLLACLPGPPAAQLSRSRPRIAVLVPAHNESAIILKALESIHGQLQEGDQLLVVADNCTDDTAALARSAGAQVVERQDALRRGKGYALDFGVRHLAETPPQVVIIVDADCEVGEGAIDLLARSCAGTGRPTQALYLTRAPAGAGLKVQVAEFAWRVKNLVRPRGSARVGLPCQLMGAGMAIAWEDLALIDLANGHLVEDIKMGVDFCQNGKPPLFCPAAQVTSYFPGSDEGLTSQRTRWEHGHLGMLLGDAPRLILQSIARRNWNLLAMTVDLMVPPLALLVLALVAIFSVSWLAFALFDVLAPALIATAAIVMLGAAVLLAWSRFSREVIAFSVLLYAPFYAARKIPLYLGFLIKRQVEWVRSKRDDS